MWESASTFFNTSNFSAFLTNVLNFISCIKWSQFNASVKEWIRLRHFDIALKLFISSNLSPKQIEKVLRTCFVFFFLIEKWYQEKGLMKDCSLLVCSGSAALKKSSNLRKNCI
jgi:hypothetical protein